MGEKIKENVLQTNVSEEYAAPILRVKVGRVTEVDYNIEENNKSVRITFRTNTQLLSQQINVMASLTAACSSETVVPDCTAS
jgi:hypothetical protein